MHNLLRIKDNIYEPLEANSVRHNDVLMNSERHWYGYVDAVGHIRIPSIGLDLPCN